MKQAIMMVVAASMLAASGAYASGAPAAKADPAKAKQIVETICVGCHGTDGNSPLAANPRLSGQHAAYLTRQLQNFKSGERMNPIMMGMSAALTPEDMLNLGAYFSEQKPLPVVGKEINKELAAKGEKIYRGGIMASSVPACIGCHGQTGNGIPAQYPRLTGQHGEYIETQLKIFRTGERANDPNQMMRGVATRMSDTDIKAVSEYISSLN